MKSAEEIMEILEAYDLTGSCRDAAVLAGCSHHTVAQYVRARAEGRLTPGRAEQRPMLIDAFLAKLEEWVEHSRGRIRADVAHDKLAALGYTVRAHDPPGGGGGQVGVPVGPAAGAPAVDPGAGDVVPVRLR